jgi:hypothetical protein
VEVDSVPGDPTVPITVWRAPASEGGGLLGHALAVRLLAAYTRRGDTVLDATASQAGGDLALAGTAAAAGRACRAIPRRGGEGVDEAALAVCSWPLPRAGLIDSVFTLGGLRRRLRPGGVLAVIVPAPVRCSAKANNSSKASR